MRISFFVTMFAVGMAVTCNAATLRFDFGQPNSPTENYHQAPGNYNHVFAVGQVLTPSDAIDITGASTGIGLTITGVNGNPGFNNVGPNFDGVGSINHPGTPTGAAAIFHPNATRDSLFGHSDNFNVGSPRPKATLVFTGLDGSGATTYDFTFFASRMGVGAGDTRPTRYSVAGVNTGESILNVGNNNSEVAIVSGITPTAAGELTITVDSAAPLEQAGARFFYLGAMQIESSAVIPEPTTIGLMSLAGVFALGWRRSR